MIKNTLKECCENCEHIDVKTVKPVLFNYCFRTTEISTEISCSHRKVCKKYIEETEMSAFDKMKEEADNLVERVKETLENLEGMQDQLKKEE